MFCLCHVNPYVLIITIVKSDTDPSVLPIVCMVACCAQFVSLRDLQNGLRDLVRLG